MGHKSVALPFSGPGYTLTLHSHPILHFVQIPYTLHQALLSPTPTIAVASCMVSLVQALLPLSIFSTCKWDLFFRCNNSSILPRHQRMTSKIPRAHNALASAFPPSHLQPTSQLIPIPLHSTLSSCLRSQAASSKKPSLTVPDRPRYLSPRCPAFRAYLYDSLGLLHALYCLQVSLTSPCWTFNSFRATTMAFYFCEPALGMGPGTWKTLSKRLLK